MVSRRTLFSGLVVGAAIPPPSASAATSSPSQDQAAAAAAPAEPLTPEAFGAVGDGETDDSAALTAALNSGSPIRCQSARRYRVDTKILVENKSVDVDFADSVLLDNTSTGQVLHLRLTPTKTGTVAGITSATSPGGSTLTSLRIADTAGIAPGDVIKIYSDDLISPKPDERLGELAEVQSVGSGAVVLTSTLLLPHATNVRFAILNRAVGARVSNVRFDTNFGDEVTRGFAYCLNVEGFVRPRFENIHAHRGLGILLLTQSCYRAQGRAISADYLRDAITRGGFGYGVADYGSQYSEWHELDMANVRHAYTTGSNASEANGPDPFGYGGAVRCRVSSGRCVNATNYAWDTHEDAYQCSFGDVYASGDFRIDTAHAGAAQDRGADTIFDRLTYHSTDTTTARNGFAASFKCNTHIKEFNYVGGAHAVNGFATVASRIRIDVLNIFMTNRIGNVVWSNPLVHISLGDVHIHLTQRSRKIALTSEYRVFRMNGGSLTVGRVIWHLQGHPAGVLSGAPQLVSIEEPSQDILIHEHILELDDNTASMAAIQVFDGQKFAFSHFKCATRIFYPDFDGVLPAATNYIANAGGGRVLHSFDVEGVPTRLTFSQSRQAAFSAGTALFFGPNLAPYKAQQFPLAYERIEKVIEGRSSSATVGAIPLPAFEGQRLTLMAARNSDTTGPLYPVKILASTTGARLTADLIINQGGVVNLIAMKYAGAILWEPA